MTGSQFSPSKLSTTVIAVDVGGTQIKLGLLREGVILERVAIESRSMQGLGAQLPRLTEAIGRLCEKSEISASACVAIGIAFPSIVDSDTGAILDHFGKFADAPEIDLRKWSQDSFGLPLAIDNDARMAAVGEWRRGAGRGCDDLVMATFGTGLGTAVVVGGQLLRGAHHQAGILGGHVSVRYDGQQCACGNRGCAEAEASTATLPSRARRRSDFAASPLSKLDVIDYAHLFRIARDGDPCAIALRGHTVDVWSAFLANLIHAYDPQRLIVGGGIVAGAADFLPQLIEHVLARVRTPWGKVEILPASLGNDAALFGCEWAIQDGLAK